MRKENERLTFKPVALPCGEDGSNRLYTANIFVGGCPHQCLYCYAAGFKAYSGGHPQPIPPEAVRKVRKWPRRLFLSSASDPFHPIAARTVEELLRAALPTGTFLVISTKALATPGIIEILSQYPDQVSYTVSLSSLNKDRNRCLEPNAPTGEERLGVVNQLSKKGLRITLKIDTIFPELDDVDESLLALLSEGRSSGVKAVTFSYAFYRNRFKKKLTGIPLLEKSLAAMTENQPIASGKGFSLPLLEKAERLAKMARMANDLGYIVISTCECKNRIGTLPIDVPMRLDCHFHDKWF